MTERRSRHAADTRSRPMPRDLPVPPPPSPVRTAVRPTRVRRLTRRPRRWGRTLRAFLATGPGKWMLVALACVAVIIVGLIGEGFLSSPTPNEALPSAGNAAREPSGGSSAGPSASTRPVQPTGKATAVVSDPVQALRDSLPDNPLNHLHGGTLHNVRITAASDDRIAVLGYLMPTGLDAPYGAVKSPPSHWALSQKALGKGYLAAVFVQAGRSGAPVTCQVTVDGKVTNTESTSGPYGRAVCLG